MNARHLLPNATRPLSLLVLALAATMGCGPEYLQADERVDGASLARTALRSRPVSDAEVVERYLASGHRGRHDRPRVRSWVAAETFNLPHGIGGDENLIFLAEPLHGRVSVVDRRSGEEVATVPAPEGGFLLPLELRTPGEGKLVVMDAGGFPNPVLPSIARIYDYSYSYNRRTGTFSAELTRSVRFDNLPAVFAEDVEVLEDGRYIVSESVIGALWVIETDGSIRPGIFPQSPMPEHAIPGLGPCMFPSGPHTVGGVPFDPPGGFAPGVGSLTANDGYLYFGSTCAGGVRRVPLDALSDSRLPHERAASIEVVSPRTSPSELDILKGLSFNPDERDGDWLYATAPFQLQIIRVNIHTGERQVLDDDPLLFNFPVSAKFIPTRNRNHHHMLVASDQEHRFTAFNAAIESDQFQLPFLISEVRVKGGRGHHHHHDDHCED